MDERAEEVLSARNYNACSGCLEFGFFRAYHACFAAQNGNYNDAALPRCFHRGARPLGCGFSCHGSGDMACGFLAPPILNESLLQKQKADARNERLVASCVAGGVPAVLSPLCLRVKRRECEKSKYAGVQSLLVMDKFCTE